MEISRRRTFALLGGASLIPLLARCTPAETAAWVAAEEAIGQEFAAVAPELAGLGVNVNTSFTVAGQAVTVGGVAALVSNATSALSAASADSVGQTTLVKIEAYINTMTGAIWPVIGPVVSAASPPVGFTIGLIVAAMPAIEGMLNFAVDFGGTLLSADALALAKLAPQPASARFTMHPGLVPVVSPQQYLNLLLQRAAAGAVVTGTR
jgi:hypothetical protein